MKENGKKNGPCHAQHVEVLNHLTDTLKDELKRGLTLLDNCVNQLAQAKWILINVERTMEDFYTDCPACDGAPKGTRATTPPSSTLTTQPSSSGNAVAKKSAKAKKASVLPMVSGHTVQRPKINIARVDARTNKRSKRAESTSGGRGRSRGSANTAIAEDDVNHTNETSASVGTPSRKKLKPGPRSKTRIIANGGIPVSSFVGDGNDVAVELEDIGYLLDGRETLKGSELSSLMGGDAVIDTTERASSSNTLLNSEKSEKKRKIEMSDDEADSTSVKKKTEDKVTTKSKPLASLKSSTTASGTTIPVKPEIMKSLIQQTFLKFTKGKQQPSPKLPIIPPKSTETAGGSSDKKGNVSDDSSVDKNKKEKSDQPIDKKMSDDSDNNDSDNDNLATLKQKRGRAAATANKRARKKNNSSGDDSDYEVSKSANKRSPSKRGGKAVNNLSDNDSSEAASFSLTKRKSGRTGARHKINVKDSSDESSTAGALKKKPKTKSPDRRLSVGKDENKSTLSSFSRRESKDDDKNSEKSSEHRSRRSRSPDRTLPVVSKTNTAKRTGGKPGPKSAKLREQEKEKQQGENDGGDTNASKTKKASAISSAIVFTDSDNDSDNGVDNIVRATIKNIPLDLQDAVRSPSPQNTKDIFGKLLSTYNTSQQSRSFEKLKNRAKPIKNKLFELDADLQEKLSSVGRELVPYTGSIDVNKNTFVIGKYYIIGKGADEKLVFFDSSQELQELDLAPDDIDELLDD